MYRLGMLLSYFYLINDSIKMLEFTKKLTSHYQKNPFLIEYSMSNTKIEINILCLFGGGEIQYGPKVIAELLYKNIETIGNVVFIVSTH